MKAGGKALALVGLVALACCTKAAAPRAGQRHPWTIPGVFRYEVPSDPKSLNPLTYPLEPTLTIATFIYSWAIRYDGKAHPFPDALREVPTVGNGDVSRDGLTLRYKLRRGMKWQDGQPLTCDDLRFTWRAVMNPSNDVASTDGYNDIHDIDCSNPYVAVIHMTRVYAPYLQQLWSAAGSVPILPAHILSRYNDAKGSLNSAPYNALPVGSGPFRVVWWRRGEEVRLAANPGFYLGAPRLREVIFKIRPGGDSAMQLRVHEVDMALPSAKDWPRLAGLVADPKNGFVTGHLDEFEWTHIDFNLDRPIVSDRSVRAALAYATDRREILTKLLHDLPIPAETDQSPRLSWAFTSDVPHYPYDPQKARALLESDGWKVGADGIRAKGGRRLAFTFSACAEYKGEVAIQTLVQQQWRQVGVDAEIKNYSHNLFFDYSPAGILEGGYYDVAIQSSSSGPDPDHSALYSANNVAPRGQNTLRWRNAAATAAMRDALASVNQSRRKRDYIVAQQQLARDVPTIVIAFVRAPIVYSADLRGFDVSPVSVFWDPWRLSI
ncbi:MAG: peptide ABC transporter substrate-binding protein [Candidatus Cybelea sp.]